MSSHRIKTRVACGLLVGLTWLVHAQAASVTWTGTTSTAWGTTTNWSGLVAPVNGDYLVFTGGNPTNQPSNNDLSSLSLSSLIFADATFTSPLSLGGNAFTLTPLTTSGASFSRTVGSTTVTVTQANHGLTTGQYVTFSTGSTGINTSATITVLTGSTFTYTSGTSGTSAAIATTGTYTPATLNNLNTTANRDVTIANGITVAGSQRWYAPLDADAVTKITGNLTGTAGSTITINSNDARTTLPVWRLSGSNGGYLGNIDLGGNTTAGIMLVNANAMVGGYLSLTTAGDQSLWLNGSTVVNGGTAVGTYTLLAGKVAGGVEFRNAGTTNGIHVTGGDIDWRPGNTASYSTTTGTLGGGLIRIGPQLAAETTPYVINFGNVGDTISSGTFANAAGAGGNGPAIFEVNNSGGNTIFNIRSALSGTGNFSLGAPLGILNAASTGSGRLTVGSGGALSISSMSQLPTGNLNVAGTLILDGVSWSTFAAARSSGTGTGQWQSAAGVGFAARGSAVTIDSQSTNASTFDKNFSIGSGLLGTNGQLYASAGVTIAPNTTLTGQRTVTVGANGTGLNSGTPVLNRISGNLSGTGAPFVQGGSSNTSTPGELVLAGANSWTGAPSGFAVNSGVFMNVGQGGLIVTKALVRFDGDASLPSGVGSTAYIAAEQRNDSTPFGFLLTGSAVTATYDLPANYRFLIGTTGSSAPASNGVFGVDGGKAQIQSSSLLINSNVDAGMTVQLLARTGSELMLGAASQPFNIIPTVGADAAASSTATTYTNSTSTTKTLVKRGEGTIALANVGYVQLDGTTSQVARFAWQVGRGTGGNSGTAAYFDGAVRGLAPNDPAADNSNSLKNFFMELRGGVYEIDNSGGGSGTFAATLGISGTGKVSVGNISGNTTAGGGGFSAYGGNVTVTLTATSGTTTALSWAASNSGFVQTNDPLMFGSETATAKLDFTNAIDLNGGFREIRVFDNTGSSGDYAVMSGVLSGNSSSGLNKTGAGLLELSAANTYSGTTTSSAGTLRIANNLALQNSALDTSGTGAVTLTVTAPTFGGLVGSTNLASVISSGYGSVTALTFNPGSGLTRTYTGAIADGAAGMTVTKTGAGTQILGGANAYTGDTTVSTGTLQLGVGSSLVGNISNAAALVLLQGGTGAGVASGLVTGTGSLTMDGGGTVRLSNTANTYTGRTTIASGVLEAVAIASAGVSSSLGSASGASATIALGGGATSGTLRYIGTADTSTNRNFDLGSNAGGGIDAAGQGALAVSGSVTGGTGAKTFTLTGTSTALNTIGSITGTGVAVVKNGTGLWRMNAASKGFGGALTVKNGTLQLATAGAAGDTVAIGDTAAGASGQAAFLLEQGVAASTSFDVLASAGTQAVLIGGANTSGTATSNGSIRMSRGVTLVAATGGAVDFSGGWFGATQGSPADQNVTIGAAGYAGRALLNYSGTLATSGSVAIEQGTAVLGFGTTITSAGTLTTANGATLAGVGAVAGVIGGGGLVAPGNSPGILTAGGIDPTGGLDLAFEFLGATPDYTDPENSINDVLRLTGTSPFSSSLASINTVSLYLPAGAAAGSIYEGGFFTDRTAAQFSTFLTTIGNADFVAYVADPSGPVSYNGTNYSLLGLAVTVGTKTVPTAGFAGGTVVNGQVTTFAIVPEPAAIGLAGVGVALAGWRFLRRRRG